jgi:predicted DNA-binding transcriptional regulator YafY
MTNNTLTRQWQTLRLLPRSPKSITVYELWKKLEQKGYSITRRTLERDLLLLKDEFALNVNDSKRPQQWGWDAEAPPMLAPLLSHSESLTLLMAEQYLSGVLPASTLGNMRHYFKLANESLAPQNSKPSESNWRNKVRMLPSNQALLPPMIDDIVLAHIQESLLLEKQCLVRYYKRDYKSDATRLERRNTYPIHPLALIQRGPLLYLICTIKTYTDIKILAMHRIEAVELTNEPIIKPIDFNLDTYIASGALGWGSQSETIVLDAKFTGLAGVSIQEIPLSNDQTMTMTESGDWILKATVQWTPQLEWWLLAFGTGVTVLAPESLRSHIAKTVQAMAQQYLPAC